METTPDDIIQDKILQEFETAQYTIKTDKLDMSFGEISSMYGRGDLVISPDYQRLFRWTLQQRTLFIESIILGIPIPSIFVAETENGKWELVDGLQRISTVISFFGQLNNENGLVSWNLTKGDFIPSFEGLNHLSLPKKILLRIRNRPIRIEIILTGNNKNLKYELFRRLNTGGSILTDQEIRNAIYRGISPEFNNFINNLSNNLKFIELVSPTDKQIREQYLDELVLRFISLFINGEEIQVRVSDFMFDFMDKEVNNHFLSYPEIESTFIKTIDILYPLGYKIFRHKNGVFSTSLYDAIMTGIAKNLEYYIKMESSEVEMRIQNIKNSDDFKKFMGSASSNPSSIKSKLKIAFNIFDPKNVPV